MWVAEASPDEPAAVRFDAPPDQAALSWIVDVPALEATLAQAVTFQPGIDVLDQPPGTPR
jgi:hypothetical protein